MPPKHIFADTSDAKSATGKVEYNIVFDVSLIARCNDGAYKLLKIRSSGRYHDPGGGKAHIKYVFIFQKLVRGHKDEAVSHLLADQEKGEHDCEGM